MPETPDEGKERIRGNLAPGGLLKPLALFPVMASELDTTRVPHGESY